MNKMLFFTVTNESCLIILNTRSQTKIYVYEKQNSMNINDVVNFRLGNKITSYCNQFQRRYCEFLNNIKLSSPILFNKK